MPKYIEAEALKPDYIVGSTSTNTECYRYVSLKQIMNAPAADVRKNVHAHWIREEHFGGIFKCSNCGQYVDFKGLKGAPDPTNFCPYCGAEMAREERK